MTTTTTLPLHNRLVLVALATDAGQRLMPGLCALRYSGRRSGRPVILPVGHAIVGDDVVVLVGRPETKRWWHNFRGGHAVEVLLGNVWHTGRGEVVLADRLEYPRLLAIYRQAHRYTSADTTDPVVHVRLHRAPRT
jgi:hypothetical protein